MPDSLPPRPSLEWLRKSAKARLATLKTSDPLAKLAHAQLAVAREHGFSSWRALKAHVERQQRAPASLPDEAVRAFFQRVGTGEIEAVRAGLEALPELVNAVGPHPFWGGRPQALHVAIESRRPEMIHLLLDRGADVNGANDQYDGWSPLMLALNRRTPAIVDELCRRGARVGLLEALMLADDERVAELLPEGRLPDVRPNGGSILAFARTPFAIDRLIALGAPLELADRWGATPIEAMSRLGPGGRALVEHMLSRGVPAAPEEYARLGDRDALERFVARDPAIARRDAVMMGAVDFGHHVLVEWLLARGASPDARSAAESRHTALHSAAWNGDLRMAELLVRAGADRHALDAQYQASPIGWAETAMEITNNPRCAVVIEYLQRLQSEGR